LGYGRAAMVTAYILVQCAPGVPQVSSEISDIKGVTSAEDVSGPYDVIVRAEARSLDELAQKIMVPIQGIPGVTRTLTCPIPGA
jgi:DNA-binding Lrp family transcriptional regulator